MQAVVNFATLPAILNATEVLRERLSKRIEAEMFLVMHALPLSIG